MVNLFEAAAGDASLTTEIVDSMRSAATSAGLTFADDPFQFVQIASENPPLKAAIENHLLQIATSHGLSFVPESSASVSESKVVLDALKDKPTQVPVGEPIALIFIAAALIFLPSILGIAGGTMFGSEEIAHAVEGLNLPE